MSTFQLDVKGVRAGYGGVPVIHSVDIRIEKGEVVRITGANGAGKSTLLATISGVLRPVLGGEVIYSGRAIHDRPAYEIARMGLVHVLERRRLAPFMTVWENLQLGIHAISRSERGGWHDRLNQMVAKYPVLEAKRDRLASELSGGQQQLVAVVRGLLADPDTLLLDEPFQGLDASAFEDVRKLLLQANADGRTLIFTEHRGEVSGAMDERVVHLERGRVLDESSSR